MCISNNLKDFLRSTAFETGNCFYVSDLKKILFFSSNNMYEDIEEPISRKLLEQLLDFSVKILDFDKPYFFANKRRLTIPIMEQKSLNIKWKSQIILPIYIHDSLFGSLIMTNFHKTFYKKHLESLKVTESFVTNYIVDYLAKLEKGVGNS